MMIIYSILVLALIILVHEVGHFVAARRAGIQVYEFSLGFGPRIASVNKKKEGEEPRQDQTEFSLRLFPIGGYVRMAGESPDDEDSPWGLNKATPLQRMGVLAAGPGMNFVLAVFLFVCAFTLIGIPEPIDKAVIGEVVTGQPAAEAGMLKGDRVVNIGGQNVETWEQLVSAIHASKPGEDLPLVIERQGEILEIAAIPEFNVTTKVPVLGISPTVSFHKSGLWDGIKAGFVNTYMTTVLMLQGLVQIITGTVSTTELAGPVGITRMIGDAAQGGLVYLINFTAMLSINLGVINLLPFPALDGSRIVFSGLEMVRRRPLDPEREGMIHLIGFIILMSLIALVTYNDILNLIRG